jgi:hypothetical protein
LIVLTDIEGSKIVTLDPNGLAGGVATGVGAVVHGFVAAEAVEAPPASRAGTTHATANAARAFRTALNDICLLLH